MNMNTIKYLAFIFIILAPVVVVKGQFVPVPVIEEAIRENSSIKLRSNELERIKREANKTNKTNKTNKKSQIKFAEIRQDFESIQKLQSSIIKTYITGKIINFSRIYKKAEAMNKSAQRLDKNLFGEKKNGEKKVRKNANNDRKGVKSLIIELDKAIGKFVSSPIFKDTNTVDSKSSKKAQNELSKIIYLSQNLSNAANRRKRN